MGVIVYVSLSGAFPFEEDRDIYEQIMDSKFLFPPDTWENLDTGLSIFFNSFLKVKVLIKKIIFFKAIDLINQFLQVKIDRRMSVNRALKHKWFSEDQQLYFDLLDLEKKADCKWLTDETQAQKWDDNQDQDQIIHL